MDTSQAEEALVAGYRDALLACRRLLDQAYAAISASESRLDDAINRHLDVTKLQRSTLRRHLVRSPDGNGGFSNHLLLHRRTRGYLDLSWSKALKGTFGRHYQRVRSTANDAYMSAVLAGTHPGEASMLSAMELHTRRFRRVDRELREAKRQLTNLICVFGLLDAKSDPRRRRS